MTIVRILALGALIYYLVVTIRYKMLLQQKEEKGDKLYDDAIKALFDGNSTEKNSKMEEMKKVRQEEEDIKQKLKHISVTWGLWVGVGLTILTILRR